VRLADCFIDVLAFAKLFLRKPTDGYDDFRRRVEKLLGDSRVAAERAGYSAEDYQSALFAVVAYVDEAVMTSQWPDAANWRKALLQQAHFGTTKAGVEFFERVDRLSAQNKAVREVYYFCMMLGFKGQYVYKGDLAGLQSVKQKTLELLVEGSETAGLASGTVLFPSAYLQQEAPTRPTRAPIAKSTLIALILPPVLIALLYLLYHFLLAQLAGNFSLFIR